ncbi:MAG: ABC transporter ATP-binding protein [Gammaproteobacteria bacterium]|nr:ABC transporter ATP-binding protein [Gammaproteobacteria bacterium]
MTNQGIAARELTKKYGEFEAAADLSFTVEPGKIVGLLGPNGAGKTTVLRMLAGILQPSAGTISVCGFPIATRLFEVKKRIGFLSNDTQLYVRLSPREVLRYFGRLHLMDAACLEERIENLIERFDMREFADRPVSTLSSGQKQRANIARTILHDPQALILDEVTTALDVISSQFIMNFLREARDHNRAILFSTHIMSEAEYLCDEILLIHKGCIIDSGSPRDLISRNGSANLTEAFLARISKTEGL